MKDSSLLNTSLLKKFRSFQFTTARKILHSWIRPTILGCNESYLGLEPDDLVCYVLFSRSIGDLLVLDHACEEAHLPLPTSPMSNFESRSFFFLGHSEGTLGRKTQREQSARMQRLFQHQASDELSTEARSIKARSIKIVPVSLFWGHQPDKEKSIFKLILSENWTVTSRLKKIFAGLFHPSHILVQFSKAIDLAELMSGESEKEKQKRKLLRLLRVHFMRQKQAIIGPDLSHRRTLINSIMTSSSVLSAIDQEIEKEHKSKYDIEKVAFSYAQEIAADQSYRVVRFFSVLLAWLWNKLYDGIEISRIETAKELAKSHEIVYIPCHRSHIDYLLLSYVLYNNGLTPPHIAAGKNLNLPIVGPLLRRGGAFFMRRSFRDNPLYRSVFDEYLNLMFNRGFSIEYFIEGGRSRTGRTLSPRTGMLNMTMRSFQRNAAKPLVFLPVYFGYERILEAETYIGELSGKAKTDESIFDIFRVFRIFSKPFGKVSVNFGAPLLLSDFLDKNDANWRDRGELNPKTGKLLALDLVIGINEAVAITPVNLVATAILSTPRQTIESHRLERQVSLLQSLAQKSPFSDCMTVTKEEVPAIINHAQKITGFERITTESFGDILQASVKTAISMTYYSNNTLHVFALYSLIARIVLTKSECHIEDILTACSTLQPFLKTELFLKWSKEETDQHCHHAIKVMSDLKLLNIKNTEGTEVSTPCPTTDLYASLTDLAEIIEPTLERFFIVNALLSGDRDLSLEQLEFSAAGVAQQLSRLYGIHSPEFFEKSLFTRFILTLEQEGYIENKSGCLYVSNNFGKIKLTSETFLNNHVRYNVAQAIHHLFK